MPCEGNSWAVALHQVSILSVIIQGYICYCCCLLLLFFVLFLGGGGGGGERDRGGTGEEQNKERVWKGHMLHNCAQGKLKHKIPQKPFNPLTAVSAYLRKAEGPSQNNS